MDRAILGLSLWWLVSPLILLTPTVSHAMGFPAVRDEFGTMFGTAALCSAVIPPAVGFAVALAGHRRQARRRFAVMGAVGSVPVLFWAFGVLLAECPDGYHC